MAGSERSRSATWLFESTLDRFLPHGASPADLRRYRLVIGTAIALALVALPLVWLDYRMVGFGPTAMTFTIAIPFMMANVYALRTGIDVELVGKVITFELLITLTLMSCFNGGMHSASVHWLMAVPILGMLLVNARLGLVFGVIAAVELVVFYVLNRIGIEMPNPLTHEQQELWDVVGASTAILFVTGSIGWYQTQRAKADAALRTSAARVRFIVENMELILFSVDLEGRIESLTGTKLSQMGLASDRATPKDVVGASAVEVLANFADFEQHLQSALRGDSCQFDAFVGGRHFETWLVPVRDKEGSIRGATGMAADSSERKEMAAKLALSERLASVGSLASGVCHEINNPLMYILTNIDLALESAQEPEAREALLEAKEGAIRVQSIVGDLGTFSRPDKLKLVAVDLVPVLEMATRMASNEIRHRARLVTDYQAVPTVLADAGRLGQVVINLLLNAAQAIAPGNIEENEIRICTRLGEQDRVVVEVCDTGCGVPAAVLSRIFDPFFSTRQVEGTGLGLSIAKSLVESFGGSIEVERRAVGTCFRVLLAIQIDAALAPAPPTPPKEVVPRPGALILVVDDDASVLRALCRILRGFELATATSGREAIELLEERTFDLILCDLMMPDLTGMDVYRWLEGNHPGLEQNMLFITGGAFTEEQKEFLAQLPSDCLYKPIAPQQLLKAVQGRLASS